ncbi:metallophosphoesterase [Pseudoduganella umbonata]|uniref:Metallophosphoesterase n=1 Tax=Pseudoduganella umbonata TaxID=864828 RepID=A0A4V1EE18_9BURK|nr:metallophosphoesterase [Pseudoduganella umbonata]MBB3222909.1 putative phosphodiesterase [Pseudoduganella umbonata]QCP13031.1 metallophosphoesterase [Pseudoduganella umbonata]
MRLLILSDLHREFWTRQIAFDTSASNPDAVILAGDIDTSGVRAVQWAAREFAGIPVLYVHGNHEGYGHNLDSEQQKIQAASAATDNVKFLDCGEYRIGNVRFLGAALWTDFKLFGDDRRFFAMTRAETAMNDYRRIRLAGKGYKRLRAADTALFHEQHKGWLASRLAEPHDGPTVVVTHMAPSMKSVPEQYAGDLTSSAYASNLDSLVASADLWVHGHMHESFDYRIGECRVICNPHGYMTRMGEPENESFQASFIVEI